MDELAQQCENRRAYRIAALDDDDDGVDAVLHNLRHPGMVVAVPQAVMCDGRASRTRQLIQAVTSFY